MIKGQDPSGCRTTPRIFHDPLLFDMIIDVLACGIKDQSPCDGWDIGGPRHKYATGPAVAKSGIVKLPPVLPDSSVSPSHPFLLPFLQTPVVFRMGLF